MRCCWRARGGSVEAADGSLAADRSLDRDRSLGVGDDGADWRFAAVRAPIVRPMDRAVADVPDHGPSLRLALLRGQAWTLDAAVVDVGLDVGLVVAHRVGRADGRVVGRLGAGSEQSESESDREEAHGTALTRSDERASGQITR